MLGEKLGDLLGQNISVRVLPDEGHGPRMEITNEQHGTMLGESVTATVTYVGTMRPNGMIHGTANGVMMTATGGFATFTGNGVGRIVRPGATSWRGCLVYETPTPELSVLNGIAVLFEYEVDEGGKSEGKLYEWK